MDARAFSRKTVWGLMLAVACLGGGPAMASDRLGPADSLGFEHGGSAVVRGNVAPTLNLTQPSGGITVGQGDTVTIGWTDSDPDDDAKISLAYDSDCSEGGHTWIAFMLSENADGSSGQYNWDTSGVPLGTYRIWGFIYDGTNTEVYDCAPGTVTIQDSPTDIVTEIGLRGTIDCDEDGSVVIWSNGSWVNRTAYLDTGTSSSDDVYVYIQKTVPSGQTATFRLRSTAGYDNSHVGSSYRWNFLLSGTVLSDYYASVNGYEVGPFYVRERAPNPADLVVSSLSPSVGGPYTIGQAVEWSCVVRNSGGGIAPSSDVGYYIGTSPTDLSNQFDSDGVNSLDPGETDSESEIYTFGAGDAGMRYLICRADDDNDVNECGSGAEGNNLRAFGPFAVIPPYHTPYNIIDLGTLPGGEQSEAYGLNELGQAVGVSDTETGEGPQRDWGWHAFRWQGGVMMDLGVVAGGEQSTAYDINNLGQISGESTVTSGEMPDLRGTTNVPFIYSGGAMTPLIMPVDGIYYYPFAGFGINDNGWVVGWGGQEYKAYDQYRGAFLWRDGMFSSMSPIVGSYSMALAVNNAGQIVGESYDIAFVWSEWGGLTDLGTLGGNDSEAIDINELGQIVGWAEPPGTYYNHAFLYNPGGGMIDLGTLGGNWSRACAVNTQGQVVGACQASGGNIAFLWEEGTMYSLSGLVTNVSGWSLTDAEDINDHKWILGSGTAPGSGERHAFLMVPDQDSDEDGVNDGFDNCSFTENSDQADADEDGRGDVCDECPDDPIKVFPGFCGCGRLDTDSNLDGIPDCDCNTNGIPDECDLDCNAPDCEDYAGVCGQASDCNTNGVPDECEINATQEYVAIQIDAEIGGDGGDAFDVNDVGQVVGRVEFDEMGTMAYIWEDGIIAPLGTLGGTYSAAHGLNNLGHVVGQSSTIEDTKAPTHAFLWDGVKMTDLGAFGGNSSNATDINDAGQIVGFASGEEDGIMGFLYEEGEMTDLGSLGGPDTFAYGINASGWIVGESELEEGPGHAFLWIEGTMYDLGTLGGDYSIATAINDLGQVVGMSETYSGDTRAFLWEEGQMTDLGMMAGEWPAAIAADINNKGQIVGFFGWYDASAKGSLMDMLGGPPVAVWVWEDGVMTDVRSLVANGHEWLFWMAMGINEDGWLAGAGEHQSEMMSPYVLIPEPFGTDCNTNGVLDECDVAAGTSEDLNLNGHPDECEDVADCNTNNIPDEWDIDEGTSVDCNFNTVPDECDLAGGTSTDCQPNGTLDECDIAAPLAYIAIIDLGTLPGGNWAYANAINNANQVVGDADTGEGGAAFLWDSGVMTVLEGPGEGQTAAFDINDAGQVAGSFYTGESWYDHALLWDGEEMIDLGTLGGRYSQSTALNDLGHVVGGGETEEDGYHAFLWTGVGTNGMQDLGTLGGEYSYAADINNAGQVVGSADDEEGYGRAVIWDGAGGIVELGTLGGEYSDAQAINDSGQVVGGSETGSEAHHAFLWDPINGMIDIGPEDAYSEAYATDINNRGQVVGEVSEGEYLEKYEGCYPFIYSDGVMHNLNDLIPPGTGWELSCYEGTSINDAGVIVGYGTYLGGEEDRSFMAIPAPAGTSLDCNENEVPDECELADGFATDCNTNGVLDECELADETATDCNTNGTLDECDIAAGDSGDCDGDGTPDECEQCGDFDNDGDVDVDDYIVFRASYSRGFGQDGYEPCADLDGDGVVTLVDYRRWLACYRDFIGDPLAGPPELPSLDRRHTPEGDLVRDAIVVPTPKPVGERLTSETPTDH